MWFIWLSFLWKFASFQLLCPFCGNLQVSKWNAIFVFSPAAVKSKFLHWHCLDVCSSGNHYLYIQVRPMSYSQLPSLIIQNEDGDKNICFCCQNLLAHVSFLSVLNSAISFLTYMISDKKYHSRIGMLLQGYLLWKLNTCFLT